MAKSLSAEFIPFISFKDFFILKLSVRQNQSNYYLWWTLFICLFSFSSPLSVSLPHSLFLQKGLLISPETHLMFLTEGERKRGDTLYSQSGHSADLLRS